MKKNNYQKWTLVLTAALVFTLFMAFYAQGVPSGASVVSILNDTGPTSSPSSQVTDGGTIGTVNLNSIQQNPGWKAYVGNVTGSLTLDDASSNTIYDWSLSTISGEVYVSRNSSVVWSTVGCAADPVLVHEQGIIGGAGGDDDSINRTYNNTNHAAMQVGVNSLAAGACRSVHTFVANTRQTDDANNNFTAVLLNDSSENLVYATFIDNDVPGFDTVTKDFQIIVPDADGGSTTTYYFYLELGG